MFTQGPQQFNFLYMQSAYFNTWFTQESLPGTVHTLRGCLAGMTFADIVYALCFAPLLKSLRNVLSSNSIGAYCYADNVKTNLYEASFADDVIIPCYCKAEALVHNATNIAKFANGVFMVYGLQLNFKPGKSEALPLFLGPGSSKAKIALQTNNFVSSLSPQVPNVSLRFVTQYKHMGTTFSVQHDSKVEVAIRSAYIISGLKKFSKVFNSPNASITRKANIAKAHTLTGGTYQCGTWPELSKPAFVKFHHTIIKVYRIVTGNLWKSMEGANIFCDQDIVFNYKLVTPSVIIRFSRLSLFFRICKKSVTIVKSLILALVNFKKGCWIEALNNDLVWFSYHPAAPKMTSIHQYLQLDPDAFTHILRELRKYAKSPFANIEVLQVSPQSVIAPSFSQYVCINCHVTKHTKQACNLHMFKCFKYKDPIRKYVPEDSVTCQVCMLRLWTRERLLNHLRYRSSTCYHNYILRGPLISNAEADDIDCSLRSVNIQLQRKGFRRHHCDMQAVRELGPVLPVILPYGVKPSAHHVLGFGHNYRNA